MKLTEFKKYSYRTESEEEAREILEWIVQGGGELRGEISYLTSPHYRYIELSSDKVSFSTYASPEFEVKSYAWWKEQVGLNGIKKTLYTLEELKEKKIVIDVRDDGHRKRMYEYFDCQGATYGSCGRAWQEQEYLKDATFINLNQRGGYMRDDGTWYRNKGYKIITVPEFFCEGGTFAIYNDRIFWAGNDMVRELKAYNGNDLVPITELSPLEAMNFELKMQATHDQYFSDLLKHNSLTQKTMGQTTGLQKLRDKVRGLKKNVRLRRDYGLENEDGSPTRDGLDLAAQLVYQDRLDEIDKYVSELEKENNKQS